MSTTLSAFSCAQQGQTAFYSTNGGAPTSTIECVPCGVCSVMRAGALRSPTASITAKVIKNHSLPMVLAADRVGTTGQAASWPGQVDQKGARGGFPGQ